MDNVSFRPRVATTSIWVLYSMIVLEILFMVSPFAAYYYSLYAVPLNALQESGATAWLTMYVLPHYSYSDSTLANVLLLASWPIILAGLVLFVFGFCQIYWAKFTRKGAVEVGLYRYIRHPQYVALAIVGLGTAIFWSRYIVGLTFASMLTLYYFLARVEERLCLAKFGESYGQYMVRTGMFLPRSLETIWRKLGIGLPRSGWPRLVAIVGLYTGLVAVTILSATVMRGHVIDSLRTTSEANLVAVFLAPLDTKFEARASTLIASHVRDTGVIDQAIAYVAPATWQVPELGLLGEGGGYERDGIEQFMHPTTHGNSLRDSGERLRVLLTQPRYLKDFSTTEHSEGNARLANALGVIPISVFELDLASGNITGVKPAQASRWQGFPVPTF